MRNRNKLHNAHGLLMQRANYGMKTKLERSNTQANCYGKLILRFFLLLSIRSATGSTVSTLFTVWYPGKSDFNSQNLVVVVVGSCVRGYAVWCMYIVHLTVSLYGLELA